MLHAVVMAGGSGTRFWPISRNEKPKQLLNLVGQGTMIQDTVRRLGALVTPERILIVTNERLVAPIASQLPELPPQALLGEPCKRDTAPCVGLAAALISRRDPEAVMVVMPADHVIDTPEQFQSAVQRAVQLVESDPRLFVTFGIRPTYPAESFGYIQRGEPWARSQANEMTYKVLRFREKPSAAVAEQYVASGDFYWNSGIFVWKASAVLQALKQFEPEMHQHLMMIADAAGSPQFEQILHQEFAAIRGKSIDYAVMERYDRVAVIEAPFGWDDLGSWRALARLREMDPDGNTVVGRHAGVRSRNCIVRSDDQHLIVTLGMQDCLVVHTPDATLVANVQDEEAIREVVKLLDERGWKEYL